MTSNINIATSENELLTAAEVAKILRVSVGFLAQMRMGIKGKASHIPFFKAGNAVRYRKSDILEYINKNIQSTKKDNVEAENE